MYVGYILFFFFFSRFVRKHSFSMKSTHVFVQEPPDVHTWTSAIHTHNYKQIFMPYEKTWTGTRFSFFSTYIKTV